MRRVQSPRQGWYLPPQARYARYELPSANGLAQHRAALRFVGDLYDDFPFMSVHCFVPERQQ